MDPRLPKNQKSPNNPKTPSTLPKLLIVDDNPLSIQVLYDIFSEDHEVFMASDGEQALEFCSSHMPDLILLDVLMPGIDGHEVCRRLQRDERTREIPVIFVTVRSNPVEEAQGLHLGAVDFITKPVNAAVVRARVRTHLLLRQMLEQVRNIAFHDPLTQLPNRRLLSDRLSQTMALSKRNGRHGAMMFLDLDNFKPLNDGYGHEVGDLLLVEVAQRLKSCVREIDTVARFGGDEFVVILSDLDTDKAQSMALASVVAQKILLALAAPYVLDVALDAAPTATVEHRCTTSIGVAMFINQDIGQYEIIKRADAAMYQAKEAGGNAVRFSEL